MKNTELLSRMTLEEKVSLLSGKDFWHLRGNVRLGIPEIMITDGPHGLRKQDPNGEQKGLSNSVPTTCFPTAATTACSWDPELLYTMGEAMAEECLQEKVSVILGPGVNMKRSPLCGRNFEYFSEDPLLAGELAAGLINGIQSKGVGTSIKHFAVNSQEKRRLTIDSVVDERAMREIYLTAFDHHRPRITHSYRFHATNEFQAADQEKDRWYQHSYTLEQLHLLEREREWSQDHDTI